MAKRSANEMLLWDMLHQTYAHYGWQREWVIKTLHSDKGYPLRFDIVCEELKLAIEIDGSQHFKMSSLFHATMSDLTRQQRHDVLKTQWCESNGWKLIRLAKHDFRDIDCIRDVLECYVE